MKLRKGFTLVELLIVIVIIGILAAAMLLSSGSATASAEASNVVSNLRSTKAALLMWYTDNMVLAASPTQVDGVLGTGGAAALANALTPYMDNAKGIANANMQFEIGTFNGTANKWFVGIPVGLNSEVAKKLKDKPGVLGSAALVPPTTDISFDPAAHATAWMVAR